MCVWGGGSCNPALSRGHLWSPNKIGPVCCHPFASKDALKQHKAAEHRKLKQFGCAFSSCSRKFTTTKALDGHVRSQHRGQIRSAMTATSLGPSFRRSLSHTVAAVAGSRGPHHAARHACADWRTLSASLRPKLGLKASRSAARSAAPASQPAPIATPTSARTRTIDVGSRHGGRGSGPARRVKLLLPPSDTARARGSGGVDAPYSKTRAAVVVRRRRWV